ncbi:Uncharacterized alpha/beta hydrolase domain [Pedococcus dokdonensis]|uniref:Uncharacterized alpha/beta hydrolase domain n=1 Tax=Pedococcus dokdonensis TaxID=443156 RepID=A0A1H0PEA6_9MICO|nr:DUF2235 domain-containing protein [Pedococcus dokdonensis]SDP03090.1 Uncharacterized alpha/beta hydrolase domain [Pedococcus dokdonensis]
MPRNLVLCLDGTSNEPETGTTNVARMFQVALKSEEQLVFYDPGVGTMGARGAATPMGRRMTRWAGLVIGFGIKDNIEEAYGWLSEHWLPGDQVYVFGFSRGAYTARALTGMLRTVGLLRVGAGNLTPYALKLYAKKGDDDATPEQEKAFWKVRREFTAHFGRPEFPHAFDTSQHQVRFLGVWDTVKSVGWLNWKARFEQARWPFTAKIQNVQTARHAMAIDERRRPFPVYRFDPELVAASKGELREMWFAGVHSDVGGQFEDDHALSDIAFDWMVREAATAGLKVDEAAYKRLMKRAYDKPVPEDLALGAIHPNSGAWALAGGWSNRVIQPGDEIHPSVHHRIEATKGTSKAYSPNLP